jgi:hypothetical protein
VRLRGASPIAAVKAAMGEVLEEVISELTAVEAERQRVAQAWARKIHGKIAPDRGYVDERTRAARMLHLPRLELTYGLVHAMLPASCAPRIHREMARLGSGHQ